MNNKFTVLLGVYDGAEPDVYIFSSTEKAEISFRDCVGFEISKNQAITYDVYREYLVAWYDESEKVDELEALYPGISNFRPDKGEEFIILCDIELDPK